MSLHQADSGTRVTRAAIADVTTEITDSDPYVTVDEDLISRTEFEGGNDATAKTGDDRTSLAFREGQVVRLSEVLAHLTPASVDDIDPATGDADGGTVVTITGSGLDGVTAVSFGGTAGTALTVTSPRSLTVTTPVHAAGAVPVVLTDDDGAVTVANGFTYTA
jgi:hypothetical protein